jgi:drug/metabolite transporter (DMT)-like permease
VARAFVRWRSTCFGDQSLPTLRARPLHEIGILLASGAIGIALADTILFRALNLIGVGLISIVDCAYSPFVILFSWLLLDEKLMWFHYVGGLLVISGVFIATRHKPPPGRTRRQIVIGMLLAPLAVALMAFGIVITKPFLRDLTVLGATTVRMAAGSVVLAVLALVSRERKAHWAVFRPSPSWRFALPASVLGNYVSMLFWVAGFTYTYASVAGILNQTSVIFSIVLAAVFLEEPLSARKVVAVVLALLGVVVVTFGDRLAAMGSGPPVLSGAGPL